MNWLITGGCGFIGTRLISTLIKETGQNIRVVDNLSVGSADYISSLKGFHKTKASEIDGGPVGIQFVETDILNLPEMKLASSGIDCIVHLAANTGVGPSVDDPMADCMANVVGIVNTLEAARLHKVKRFVFASSGAPVGEVEPPIHEELAPHPVSPYGASKLAGEGYCSAYAKCFGIGTVALRFGNVYGPGSGHKQSVVAKFIGLALAGKTLDVYGNGLQTRDFVYIDDLIEAILLAGRADGISGEVFQIATNQETNLQELLAILIPALVDAGVAEPEVSYTEARVGDVMRNYSDTTKAKNILGWNVRTQLPQGIKNTVEYFVNQTV